MCLGFFKDFTKTFRETVALSVTTSVYSLLSQVQTPSPNWIGVRHDRSNPAPVSRVKRQHERVR